MYRLFVLLSWQGWSIKGMVIQSARIQYMAQDAKVLRVTESEQRDRETATTEGHKESHNDYDIFTWPPVQACSTLIFNNNTLLLIT